MHRPYRLLGPLEAALSASAAAAEAAGTLTPEQLRIIHQEGWFRMFVPQRCGGLQTPLPLALAIEEALARIDGSLGWTVTLCSGAGLFAGFVQPSLLDRMFRDPQLCIGGSGASTGVAEQVEGGYRVSGTWQFATGAPHLTAFSANCRMVAEGRPLLEADGSEMIRSFLFDAAEVSWWKQWPVMGLKATASHSFAVSDRFVPEDRCFQLSPAAARVDDPVYRYPFLPFAELTLAANFGGMGLAFIDAFAQNLGARTGTGVKSDAQNEALEVARLRLQGLRDVFHDVAAESWESICAGGQLPDTLQQRIGDSSRALASGVRSLVSDLYPFAGIAAADPGQRINRIWRDLFTATQHALLTYPAATPA